MPKERCWTASATGPPRHGPSSTCTDQGTPWPALPCTASGPVGLRLRQLRESRGVSLDEIARATRVGRRHLEALEAGETAELPAPVFVKGFIRAYCEFLGAGPDDVLGRYHEIVGESPTSGGSRSTLGSRGRPSRLGSPIAVSLLLLVVLAGALIAVNLGLRTGASTPGAPSAPGTSADPRTPARSEPAPADRASIPAPATTAMPSTVAPTAGAAPAPSVTTPVVGTPATPTPAPTTATSGAATPRPTPET